MFLEPITSLVGVGKDDAFVNIIGRFCLAARTDPVNPSAYADTDKRGDRFQKHDDVYRAWRNGFSSIQCRITAEESDRRQKNLH